MSKPMFDRPTMAILRSSHEAAKTKPQAGSFKELLNHLSRRTQLAA
jgi:hypothetical protein